MNDTPTAEPTPAPDSAPFSNLTTDSLLAMLAELEAMAADATSTPWCWMAPGDPNGAPKHWSIGEQLEDDPPVLVAVNWHEEANVKYVSALVNRAPILIAELRRRIKTTQKKALQPAPAQPAAHPSAAYECGTCGAQWYDGIINDCGHAKNERADNKPTPCRAFLKE